VTEFRESRSHNQYHLVNVFYWTFYQLINELVADRPRRRLFSCWQATTFLLSGTVWRSARGNYTGQDKENFVGR